MGPLSRRVSRLFKSERRESAAGPEYGSPAQRSVYRLAIHLTLIAGSLIFSMPFVWMVSCSLKEDDEQMTEQLIWFPRLPPYQPRSPYIDSREGGELIRPPEVQADRWAALQASVAAALDERLDAVSLDTGSTPPEDAKLRLREALWRDLVPRIPSAEFAGAHSLRAAIAKLATAAQVRQSHRRLYRAVAIGDITLRAEGQSEVRIPARRDNKPGGELIWQLAPSVAGAGLALQQNTFEDKPEEELRYSFNRVGERADVRASVPFGGQDPPKAINIGLKTDASWNRVWFTIEFDGKRYEAVEPALLAGMGRMFGELFYQLPGPEDADDMRIRHWLITKEVPASGAHNQPGTVLVELAIENTSFATKVYDKATYNYKNSLRYIPFWRYLLTSLFLVALNIFLAVFSSSLIAFAFARLLASARRAGTLLQAGE